MKPYNGEPLEVFLRYGDEEILLVNLSKEFSEGEIPYMKRTLGELLLNVMLPDSDLPELNKAFAKADNQSPTLGPWVDMSPKTPLLPDKIDLTDPNPTPFPRQFYPDPKD